MLVSIIETTFLTKCPQKYQSDMKMKNFIKKDTLKMFAFSNQFCLFFYFIFFISSYVVDSAVYLPGVSPHTYQPHENVSYLKKFYKF